MTDQPITWKHIGLHGFAVGTLALTKDSILWKSAVSGRDDETNTAHTTRKINASKLKGAAWTVFGKTGLVRFSIASSSSGPQSSQHEWRLDGFPLSDFDALSNALSSLYNVELKTLNISSAGTQYGITKVQGKLLTLYHCTLEDDLNEEGQEFEVAVGDQICSLDLAEVSQCVLPGNNRNELELQFPETDTMEAGTDQLGEHVVVGVIVVAGADTALFVTLSLPFSHANSLLPFAVAPVTLNSRHSNVHSSRPRYRHNGQGRQFCS